MRCYFIPVTMALSKRQVTTVGEDMEKREASFTVGRKCKLVQPLHNSMEDPQNIKNTTQSRNSTSGYFSEENKNTNLKRYMYPCVNCSMIYNNQDVEKS